MKNIETAKSELTDLQERCKRIDEISDRVDDLRATLARSADHIYGAEPEKASEGDEKFRPSGILGDMDAGLDHLSRALDRCIIEAGRLSNL